MNRGGGVWGVPAEERAARLREQAQRYGDDGVAQLGDLELLNRAYESVLREQIDTRDRYMALLTELRHHDDRVRAAAVVGFQQVADRYAESQVRQHMKPFNELAYRVEQLPDWPGPVQVEALRAAAVMVRAQLEDDGRPSDWIDPGGARRALHMAHRVVRVLDGVEGLDAAEVLGQVKAALGGESLHDLFTVADRGTRPVEPELDPVFVGEGWKPLHRTLWVYQPAPAEAHIKAYPLGEEWYLDLWSADGGLLAFGTATAQEAGPLAKALVERAAGWAADRGEYGWRRFADTAQEVREAQAASPPAASPRSRAASAASPAATASGAPGIAAAPAAGSATAQRQPARVPGGARWTR